MAFQRQCFDLAAKNTPMKTRYISKPTNPRRRTRGEGEGGVPDDMVVLVKGKGPFKQDGEGAGGSWNGGAEQQPATAGDQEGVERWGSRGRMRGTVSVPLPLQPYV